MQIPRLCPRPPPHPSMQWSKTLHYKPALSMTLTLVKVLVIQPCLILCNPMDFSRKECWSGLPFPSPRELPDPS